MKEVCIVEGCPKAGRHFADEHVEEDYAVKAAREWLLLPAKVSAGCDCHYCASERIAYNLNVHALAGIVRKHVGPVLEDLRLQQRADMEAEGR